MGADGRHLDGLFLFLCCIGNCVVVVLLCFCITNFVVISLSNMGRGGQKGQYQYQTLHGGGKIGSKIGAIMINGMKVKRWTRRWRRL